MNQHLTLYSYHQLNNYDCVFTIQDTSTGDKQTYQTSISEFNKFLPTLFLE